MNNPATISEFASATGEILIMLVGAFILGWLARWVYELVMYPPFLLEDHIDEYITHDDGTVIRHHEDMVVHSEGKPEQESVDTIQEQVDTPEEQATPKKADSKKQESDVQYEATQSPVVMMPYKQDDLKMVEGIGPKIAQLLQEGGIHTWQDLANTEAEDIKTILRAAGERYRIHDPTTWPEQAQLAVEHKWDELEEYQNALSGGKDLTRIYKNTTS